MDNTVKKELSEKLKKARTPEEIISIAKENCIEMPKEVAQCYFCRQHRKSELSDEELKYVAGGDSGGFPEFVEGGWYYGHCDNWDGDEGEPQNCGHCHNYQLDWSIPRFRCIYNYVAWYWGNKV